MEPRNKTNRYPSLQPPQRIVPFVEALDSMVEGIDEWTAPAAPRRYIRQAIQCRARGPYLKVRNGVPRSNSFSAVVLHGYPRHDSTGYPARIGETSRYIASPRSVRSRVGNNRHSCRASASPSTKVLYRAQRLSLLLHRRGLIPDILHLITILGGQISACDTGLSVVE